MLSLLMGKSEPAGATILAPYALPLLSVAVFPARIIRGGSLLAVSVVFEMWGRAAWHVCSKRCLGCCWTDGMQNASLGWERVPERKSQSCSRISLLSQLSKISSFWTEGK